MRFGVRAEVLSSHESDHDKLADKTLRALVVDNNATNRQNVNRKLHCLEGKFNLTVSEVVEACDGGDAIRLFEKSSGPFDMVLMDCLMPILESLKLQTRYMRFATKKKFPVPVTAVTASIAKNVLPSVGMIYVVTKPFSLQQVKASLEELKKNCLITPKRIKKRPNPAKLAPLLLPPYPFPRKQQQHR